MKDEVMQHGDEKGKVFVGGLSWNTNNSSMLKYFSRYGEVIDCVVMKNPETGKSRGFGFVTFKDPTCVEVVLSSKCHVLDGRQIDPKACNPRSMNKGSKSLENSKKKIFIGGLPVNVTEDELVEHFSKYGPVMEVVIMLDQQKQRSRGFGFLTFETEECVEKVVNEHFIQINGKQVEVKKAEPRDMKLLNDPSMMPGNISSNISSYPVFLAPPSHFNLLHVPTPAIGQPLLAPPTNAISLISPLGLTQTPDGLFSATPSPAGPSWCSAGPGLHLVNPGSPLVLIASDGSGTGLAMTPPQTAALAYQVWSPMQSSMNEHVAFISPTQSTITVDDRHSYGEGCHGDMSVLATMYHFADGAPVVPCTNNGIMAGPMAGISTNNNTTPAILAVQPTLRNHASTPAGFHPYRR